MGQHPKVGRTPLLGTSAGRAEAPRSKAVGYPQMNLSCCKLITPQGQPLSPWSPVGCPPEAPSEIQAWSRCFQHPCSPSLCLIPWPCRGTASSHSPSSPHSAQTLLLMMCKLAQGTEINHGLDTSVRGPGGSLFGGSS